MSQFSGPEKLGGWDVAVRLGLINGADVVSVSGFLDTLTTTRVVVSPGITTEQIDQSGIHTTPATVDVASTDANDTSAGTGLRTLTLTGLDADGVLQEETITLSGQTEVTSVNTYSAINGLRGLTGGSNAKNAGTIWCGNGTFTSGVPATKYFSANVGANHGATAYYTVPAKTDLLLKAFTCTIGLAGADVDVTIEFSDDGIFWIVEQEFALRVGYAFTAAPEIDTHKVNAGEHIRITAISDAALTEVTIILGCLIVSRG